MTYKTITKLLEYDALKALHRTASLVLDPKGKPMNIDVDTIIVAKGTTNYFRAMEMLRTIEKGNQPATADRESPGVPAYKIIALPWLQSNTTYWYGQASSMKNDTYGLQYKENRGIELEGPNIVFKTDELQLVKTLVEVKPSLINGENPEVGNAQEPQKGLATTKREGLLQRVCNSLNTAYNLMKAVSWAEMPQPTLISL